MRDRFCTDGLAGNPSSSGKLCFALTTFAPSKQPFDAYNSIYVQIVRKQNGTESVLLEFKKCSSSLLFFVLHYTLQETTVPPHFLCPTLGSSCSCTVLSVCPVSCALLTVCGTRTGRPNPASGCFAFPHSLYPYLRLFLFCFLECPSASVSDWFTLGKSLSTVPCDF